MGYKYDTRKDPNDPNNYDYLMMKGKKVVEWIPIQNRHKKGLIKYVGIIAWYVTIFWLIYYLWLNGHFEIRDDKFAICVLLLALSVVLVVLLYYSFIKPHKNRWTLNKIM